MTRRLALLPLLALALACGGKTTDQDRFDALVQFTRSELARQGVPGAAVAVVVDGEVAFSAGVGTKRSGVDDPVHADTVFGIGSTTKMMVAAGLLSLREEGRIDLDAPITQALPELRLAAPFEADVQRIHLRHLLSHTAGLPDGGENLCDQSLEDFAASLRLPLWAEPGTVYDYSNLGYALAGRALERAAGKPFAEAMRERVFAPAGMDRVTFEGSAAMALDHSHGHVLMGGGPLTPVELDSSGCAYMAPSGNQTYLSAPELARFAAALVGGRGQLLGADSIAALEDTTVETHDFPGERYGLGLVSLDQPGERVLYHGGNDRRFSSSVVLAPGRRLAVVVIMNSGAGAPDFVAARALELFLGSDEGLPLPHLLRHEHAVPTSSLPRYAGTYLEPFSLGRAVIAVDGERLVGDLPDLPGAPHAVLRNVAGDAFVAGSDDLPEPIPLHFLFGADPSKADRLVTRMGIFTRVP
jgi:CubicO group peptidase (beta-lactamase class C family)